MIQVQLEILCGLIQYGLINYKKWVILCELSLGPGSKALNQKRFTFIGLNHQGQIMLKAITGTENFVVPQAQAHRKNSYGKAH